MPEQIAKGLHEYIQQKNFSSEDRIFPICYSTARAVIRRIGNRLGVVLTPYDLRRYSATHASRNGIPDDDLIGPARIGLVKFSKSGKSIHYKGRTFETLKGRGFKANYFDIETGDYYWISGCRKDGMDALYSTDVEIDDDVREKYWAEIRGMPENKNISKFRAKGKSLLSKITRDWNRLT